MFNTEVCPVVGTYVKYIQGYLEDEIVFADVYLPQLNNYAEIIVRQAATSRICQHQRAFLCIEMMLHNISQVLSVDSKQDSQYVKWERSSSGLSHLLVAIRGDNSNLAGTAMEYVLSKGMNMLSIDGPVIKKRVGDGADQMYQENRHKLIEVYRLVEEAAVVLRRSLRNPETPLTRVGRRLGQAAEVARIDTGRLFFMLDSLLDQREDHAPRAWELES